MALVIVAQFDPDVGNRKTGVDEGKAVLPYFSFYLSIPYYLTVNFCGSMPFFASSKIVTRL